MTFFYSSKIIKRKDFKKPFSRLFKASAWPPKTYILLFFAFLSGITTLYLSRTSSPITTYLQRTFLEGSGVVFSFFNQLENDFHILKEAIIHRHTWSQEKKGLETENLKLRQQLLSFENIYQENKALLKSLNVVRKQGEKFVTAPVLSNPSKGLNHTFLIGAGSLQGIQKGQPILSPYGMVGQVDQVSENVARIMPLTHRDSRIPVIGMSSRIEGIVAGDGTAFPILTYLQENHPLTPSEIFLTSRYGGRFPPGYLVGRIHQDQSGQIRIHPFIQWERLEFVQVVTSFALQSLEDQKLLKKGTGH